MAFVYLLLLFYIQQIRQAGCCGDDTEEVSGTPAPQTRSPANMDLQSWRQFFDCGKHRRSKERYTEEEGNTRHYLIRPRGKLLFTKLPLTGRLYTKPSSRNFAEKNLGKKTWISICFTSAAFFLNTVLSLFFFPLKTRKEGNQYNNSTGSKWNIGYRNRRVEWKVISGGERDKLASHLCMYVHY